MIWQALGRAYGVVLGNVRFFLMNVFKHCWISQRELGNRQADQNNLECAYIMSPTTATVKNMPNNGRGFMLSVGAYSSSSVSHVNEEQACANEVSPSNNRANLLTSSENPDSFSIRVLYSFSLNAAKSNAGLSWRFYLNHKQPSILGRKSNAH